jgi:hypothetical protein
MEELASYSPTTGTIYVRRSIESVGIFYNFTVDIPYGLLTSHRVRDAILLN